MEKIEQHFKKYSDAFGSIEKMQELGILSSGLPIKKQTLAAKKFMVKNFDQCVDVYNQWISRNPDIGQPINIELINQQIDQEKEIWRPTPESKLLT